MSNRFGSITKKYPPNGGMILCDGGLNTKYNRALIPDNESPDCLNVIFRNGAVETRPGASMVNTTAVGSFACDGLYTRHDSSGAETMVAWFGGSLYQLGTTTFTAIASATSVMTAGQRVSAAEYEDKIFFGNGGVEPYKYDGQYFTRHGVPAPATAPSAVSDGTGSLSGTYKFKVTYVNSFAVEGDLSPSGTVTVTSGIIRVTDISVAPASFGVDARRLYLATGTTFNLVSEITDNTSTTFTVTSAAVTSAAPTDKGVPPKYSQVLYHRDRLWMNDPSNPNYIWFSELGEPYTVPSTNFRLVGDGTKDLVRGFAALGESLLIVCDESAWILYMPTDSDTDWRMMRTKSSYGSKSPFAFVPYDNKIMFPAMSGDKFVGFAAMSGAALAPSTTFMTTSTAGSDRQSDRIEPDMFLVPEASVGNISGVEYQNRLFFALPYGGVSANNRVYVYDFSLENLRKSQRGAWVPFTGWNAAQFTVYGNNLYYGSSDATGRVYRCMIDSVYTDAGSPINSYYWTKEFECLDEEGFKDFRRANVYYQKVAAYYMTLGWRTDGDMGEGATVQIDLDPQTKLWGSLAYGVDPWGGGAVDGLISQPLGQARGKRVQFKFSNQNQAGQKFRVSGFSFTFNRKGTR